MQTFGSILTYVSKGDGGYLSPADSRRTDALYIAAKENRDERFTNLNKGKPILYVKWEDSVENAPNAQMGSPSLFRKPDGTYGLVASENNKGSGIYLWDSMDLIAFSNQRRIEVNRDGVALEDPKIVYDASSDTYQLFWRSGGGEVSFVSVSNDQLTSFATRTEHEYGAAEMKGILPSNALPNEASKFDVTQQEYERVIRRYAPVTNTGVQVLEDISIKAGENLPSLMDRIELFYSDGSSKFLGVNWNLEDIQAIQPTEPGSYRIRGTIVQSVFEYPFIQERADPFITYNPDDGYYYATGSYYPESDPSNWTEFEMQDIDYDRITLRRGRTLEELRSAEEFDVWVPRGEDGFVPFLWAPEVHKINGKWYILVGAGQSDSGRRWCSTMVLVEYTGTLQDMQQGGMLRRNNWKPRAIQDSPCGFDMTFAEINGTGYYIWPSRCQLYIQKVDPIDPTKRIGEAAVIKGIDWPFEYGKHNIHHTDQGIVEGAAVLQYGDKIYLSYAGATVDQYYCTAVMTADAGADVMNPDSWTRPTYAALSTEDVLAVEGIKPHCGPGHNSFSLDEYGNPINIYHARPVPDPHVGVGAGGLHDPCRHTMVRPAHIAIDGTLILNMTKEEELAPQNRNVVLTVKVIY
ncbi:family 43 glycosylhydrolase [Paenibacillus sp. PR3]|uniref:Family 43 glycosylhydrolase n=1 Tax=Paenibacillus terricola TaxID=2763503 RepID=A0ABR8N577_9BACL|nr:family 43 glycosylhydrolase [Paenibacillus terricola]MBD3922335.1 family 43 glycosylhydrolase [Paenibacillus terricola]